MDYDEQLNEQEMAMILTVLGNKPNLRNKFLNLLMEQIPVESHSPVHLMDESDVEHAQLIQNAAECHICGMIMISTNRHDFVQCACGNAVDGGLDYVRRIGDPENMTDLTVHTDTPRSIARIRLVWGSRGIDGGQPLVFRRIMDLETAHLEAILKTQHGAKAIIRTAIQDTLALRNDAAAK